MLQFRNGSADDINSILALFDANITWLVERGREAQWGKDPWSEDEKKIDFVRELLSSGDLTLAELNGDVVGASLLTDHSMPYVPAIDEPERYLKLLIASPAHRGMRIGHHLIERTRAHVIEAGIDLMRVDCWAGGDRRLVDYYISEGFTPTEEIEVRPGTSVQVFQWRASSQESTEDLSAANAGT